MKNLFFIAQHSTWFLIFQKLHSASNFEDAERESFYFPCSVAAAASEFHSCELVIVDNTV